MIIEGDEGLICQIPESVFSLDRDAAIERISHESIKSLVDRKDRPEVAGIIYDQVQEINQAPEVENNKAADEMAYKGLKGNSSTPGYLKVEQIKRNVGSLYPIKGADGKYDITVETPKGHKGTMGNTLRSDRILRIQNYNYAVDKSWAGVTR